MGDEAKGFRCLFSSAKINAGDLGDDLSICQGESITITPDGDFASYLWQDGSTGPDYTSSQEGWVGVEVSDASGCTTADSMFFTIAALPVVDLGPDTSICSTEGMILDAGGDGEFYLWSTGDISQQIFVYNEGDQVIWVEVQNASACVGGDTVLISFCNLSYFINPPTGFTPNEDGENDVWNIYDLERFDRVIVEVFDQWGTLAWKSEPGYPTSWDGFNMRGKLVPFDSYHFVIDFNDGSDERYVGYVTVMH